MSIEEENKNLSYEQLLKQVKEKGNQTAQYYIPELCKKLKEEKHKIEEIKDIVKDDLKDYWSIATIDKFIPEEYKNPIRVEQGKKGKQKQEAIKITNEGKTDNSNLTRMEQANYNPIPEMKQDPSFFSEAIEKIKKENEEYKETINNLKKQVDEKPTIEKEIFWVEYNFQIGSLKRTIRLLIDPNQKKYIKSEISK